MKKLWEHPSKVTSIVWLTISGFVLLIAIVSLFSSLDGVTSFVAVISIAIFLFSSLVFFDSKRTERIVNNILISEKVTDKVSLETFTNEENEVLGFSVGGEKYFLDNPDNFTYATEQVGPGVSVMYVTPKDDNRRKIFIIHFKTTLDQSVLAYS